jgi:class 3 adenylate cyclase
MPVMTTTLDEQALEERMAALEAARGWRPRVVSRLEALIRGGSDEELFRVNPLRFAASRGVDEGEAIDLFLHATTTGLVGMSWVLQCPLCGCIADSLASLRRVHSHFRCNTCHLDLDSTLDDRIAVTFTVSPEVRRIAFHDPASLSAADYLFGYRLSAAALAPDGRPWGALLREVARAVTWLPPGSDTALELVAEPGLLLGFDLDSEAGMLWEIDGEPASAPQRLAVTYRPGSCEPAEGLLRPGPVTLLVSNAADSRGFLGILQLPPGFERRQLDFAPFLDGKRLLTTQTFRELFRAELVQAGSGLGVRDITLLFTDLKGSTALYERIGDLDAFALVERHFEQLQEATVDHGGVIVKTIGDAVMAAFLTPADGVEAALAMQRRIERVNDERRSRDLVLKIGVHKGPAIAVTLNDRQDYFGQTVNLAARLQEQAGPDEIWLGAEVHGWPGVAERLQGLEVEARSARLRGMALEVPVYRVRARGSPERHAA